MKALLIRCFYVTQTLLITLKLDKFINWNWEYVLFALWTFIVVAIICTVQLWLSLFKKVKEFRAIEGHDSYMIKVGLVWLFLFHFLTILTIFTLYEAVKRIELRLDPWFMNVLIYMSFGIVISLFVYSVVFWSKLVCFIAIFGLMETVVVVDEQDEISLNPKKGLSPLVEKKRMYS